MSEELWDEFMFFPDRFTAALAYFGVSINLGELTDSIFSNTIIGVYLEVITMKYI